MLAATDLPIVFCLHYLGGSAREWSRVAALVSHAPCIAIDLPGFGDARESRGYTVAEMVEHVERAILAHAPQRWFLAGHSMGAKVATVIARHVVGGVGLTGLIGLVLVAASPPGPEPMPNAQRRKMLDDFNGDDGSRRRDARTFVAENVGMPLDAECEAIAIDDALRCKRTAWRAWLEKGSREDWAERIGIVQIPTLLIAGEEDANLGPSAQSLLTAPHFANVRMKTLAGAKHLLPMERALDVARAISDHIADVSYDALIASTRVGERTRKALLARATPDDPAYVPVAIDSSLFPTLRAVVACVIPQRTDQPIDLAACLDARLSAGDGDGRRFDALPSDRDAYGAALRTLDAVAHHLHGETFAALDPARQDEMLTHVAAGRLETLRGELDTSQLRAWFEDLRADAVRIYLAHPRTLARIGYSGIANGGDGVPKSGFVRVGLGEREAWEPIAVTERVR